jgi:hypothetical protein
MDGFDYVGMEWSGMFCVKVKIKPTIVMVYSCLLGNYYVMVGFMPMIVLNFFKNKL